MEKEDLKDIKKFVIEDYKFYDRRYEYVCLIISGFGLFACLEFSKMLINAKEPINDFLLSALICFALSVCVSMTTLSCEKEIRAYYLGLFFHNQDLKTKEASEKKSIKLENWVKRFGWLNLGLIIFAIMFLVLCAIEVHDILY